MKKQGKTTTPTHKRDRERERETERGNKRCKESS